MGKIVALLFFFIVSATPGRAQQLPGDSRCSDSTAAPEAVIAACTEIIRSDLEDAETRSMALKYRGDAHVDKQQLESAATDYNQAILLNSKNFRALNNRANLFMRTGKPDRALQDYAAAIQFNPTPTVPLTNRGQAYFLLGQYDRSIEDFDEAIRLAPHHIPALFARGAAYSSKGQHQFALDDYNEVIRLNSSHGRAFANRCLSRIILNPELRNAILDCDEAVRLRPREAQPLELRGTAHIKLSEFDQVSADYTAALALNPKSAFALFGRGYSKHRSGDPLGGDVDLAAAKTINANISEAFGVLGIK